MSDDLHSILMSCAFLRGVQNLPHRTLYEFNWFVQSIIFKEWENHPDMGEYQILIPYREQIEWNESDALLQWANLFYDYCLKEYRDGYKERVEEVDRLIEELERSKE